MSLHSGIVIGITKFTQLAEILYAVYRLMDAADVGSTGCNFITGQHCPAACVVIGQACDIIGCVPLLHFAPQSLFF